MSIMAIPLLLLGSYPGETERSPEGNRDLVHDRGSGACFDRCSDYFELSRLPGAIREAWPNSYWSETIFYNNPLAIDEFGTTCRSYKGTGGISTICCLFLNPRDRPTTVGAALDRSDASVGLVVGTGFSERVLPRFCFSVDVCASGRGARAARDETSSQLDFGYSFNGMQ